MGCKDGGNCKIGQRVRLSKIDILDIANLYNCGSNWSDWGPFTECCGQKQTRERTCRYDHRYKNVRIKCYGRTKDAQNCQKEHRETCIDLDKDSCGNVYQPSFSSKQKYCKGENKCFCKGDLCLISGNCSSGNLLVGGKPICKHGWDQADADVACRQLGFSNAKPPIFPSRFVLMSTKFAMSHVNCTGNERTIQQCLKRKFDFCGANDVVHLECHNLRN